MPTTTSINTIQKLYIAYYARPADPAGLNYWANALDSNSAGINAIIDAFASSTEAQSLYGSATSVTERITVLYQNILGRAPDAPGLAYYKGEIEAGRLSLGKAAFALLAGAQSSGETAVIQNRLEVAQKFTQQIETHTTPYSGSAAAAVARTLLRNVLGGADSLAQGNGKLAAYLNTVKVASQVPDKFGSIIQNGFLDNTNVVSETLTTDNIDTFIHSTDTTAPTLVSATVSDTTLVLLYNEALDAQNPANASQFTVKVGGQTVALTASNPIAVDSARKVVTLKLASPVAQGSNVTVSYADPTPGNDSKATQDKAGNDAASFNNVSVSHSAVNFLSNVKDASATNQDTSAESAARYIGSAVLFVSSDGTWSVGRPGQKISEYQKIKINGVGNVHDDSQEKTALIAETREGGGYVLYLQSNADAREFFEAIADAQGNITAGFKLLTTTELFAAEKKYGVDLNGNGGLGADMVLVDTGKTDVYVDGLGAYQLKKADGSFLALIYEGQALTQEILDSYQIEAVVPNTDGSYQLYLGNGEGSVFEMTADDTGDIETETIGTLSAGKGSVRAGTPISPTGLSDAEIKTGEDLNRAGDTVVTPGWTAVLQNAAIRAEIDTQTANGAKINHAGLVKIVDVAIQAAGSNPIGNEIYSDLQAIAARAQGLFSSQDLSGTDVGYLQYTFDQMVNGSKANNFYTGGTTKPEGLGNLSPTASADTLKKLENKWLLGKDLPNPTTEGDTANPNATAASGIYKAFNGELINGTLAADVNQGSAGTCYLLASMAAIAQVSPAAVNKMFTSNGTGTDGLQTWGVRFYDTKGQTHWVTVNNQLVVRGAEDTDAAYAKVKGVDAQGNATQEMWAPLLEKAYAQANELEIFARSTQKNSMFAIEGGLAEPVVNLAGGKVTTFTDSAITYNGNDILKTSVVPEGSTALAEYTKALNSGKVLFIVSQTNTATAGGSTLFTSGHAYMAYDADLTNPNNTSVKVYNPWGVSLPTDANPNPSHVTPFDSDLVTLVGTKGLDFWISV